MIVHVRLVVVILFPVFVVVAVRQLGVIVLVRVPCGAMLEVVAQSAFVMMRHVIVIVRVRPRRMSVGGNFALSFGPLPGHMTSS